MTCSGYINHAILNVKAAKNVGFVSPPLRHFLVPNNSGEEDNEEWVEKELLQKSTADIQTGSLG